MATGAGELDRRIRIEREQLGRDDMGGVSSEGWAPLGRPWASRADASDGERYAADEQAATRMTRFKVYSSRMTRDVTPKDRIVYRDAVTGDQFYEITGIKETTEGRNRFLEFSTVVRTDWTA